MANSTFCEKERKRLEWLNSFQLPNFYKRVGVTIVIVSFLLMIIKKLVDEPSWVKPILSSTFLLGFLIISISKEKIEDELIVNIRAQSYRLAFILGVVYSLIQPHIERLVSYLVNSEDTTSGFNYFQVLSFMLIIQLGFFYQLKRFR